MVDKEVTGSDLRNVATVCRRAEQHPAIAVVNGDLVEHCGRMARVVQQQFLQHGRSGAAWWHRFDQADKFGGRIVGTLKHLICVNPDRRGQVRRVAFRID
jgi:hypothetical protein